MRRVKLREIAHSRAGDKGDISSVSVVPYDEDHYDMLKEQLTATLVKEAYGELVKGEVKRYELPGIRSLNFVMYQALDGGVSRTLAMDLHGKSRGSVIGDIEVEIPDA